MRRKRNLLLLATAVTSLVFYYLQLNLFNVFFAAGANVPDLLLILTVFIGVRLGPIPGSLYGFAAGLVQDAAIDFYGLNALCKTIVGFMAPWYAVDRVMLAEKYYFPIVVLVSALVHSVFYYGIVSLDGEAGFLNLFYHYGFWNAWYSGVVALLLFMIGPEHWLEFFRYDVRYEY